MTKENVAKLQITRTGSVNSEKLGDILSYVEYSLFDLSVTAAILVPGFFKTCRVKQYRGLVQGKGGAVYKRAWSQPAHALRFRSADRYLPDGTISNNGGWWEIAEDKVHAHMCGVVGDSINQQFAVTAQAGNQTVLFAGTGLNPEPNFTKELIGRPIRMSLLGPGPSTYYGTIIDVTSQFTLVVSPAPAVGSSAVAKRTLIGFDDADAFQVAADYSVKRPVDCSNLGSCLLSKPVVIPNYGHLYNTGRTGRHFFYYPNRTKPDKPKTMLLGDYWSAAWADVNTKAAVTLGAYSTIDGIAVSMENGDPNNAVSCIYTKYPCTIIRGVYTWGGMHGIKVDYGDDTDPALGSGSGCPTIDNVEVSSAADAGIFLYQTYDFKVVDAWVHGCLYGIRTNGASNGQIIGGRLEDSRPTGGGLRMYNSTSPVNVIGVQFSGNPQYAISLQDMTDAISFIGCDFIGNGFETDASTWFFGTGNTGRIQITGSSYGKVLVEGSLSKTKYHAKVASGAVLGVGSCINEDWIAGAADESGVYFNTEARNVLQKYLNSSPEGTPRGYANDAAAAAAVSVGARYFDSSGVLRRRVA